MSDELCGAPTTKGGTCQNPADSCPWHNTDDPPENGRDSKLTKERQEAIAAMVEEGQSIEAAARANNVHPSNVYEWVNKGEAQEEGIYADFRERFTRAKGVREQNYFELIKELAREQGDHRFLMSMLKRRHPDSWDDTETGMDGTNITVTSDVVEVDESSIQQH